MKATVAGKQAHRAFGVGSASASSASGGGGVYIKPDPEGLVSAPPLSASSTSPFIDEFLSECVPAEELQACQLYRKILAKEAEIVALISRVEIKSLSHNDKMKVLMEAILYCVGETVKFNMKPYTSTVEFKIMESIVLKIFLYSAWYDLRSISVSEFKMKYPKLAGLHTSDKAEERKEFETLYKFRNVLCVATLLVPCNNNMDRLIGLATRIVEGLNKETGKEIRYVNGSGKTESTKIRHDIFHSEKSSNFESRDEGAYDARIEVVKSLKRKYNIPDPTDMQEHNQPKKRGRPKGKKNAKSSHANSDIWSSLIDTSSCGGSECEFSLDKVKEEPVEKRANTFVYPPAPYIKEERVASFANLEYSFPVVSCGRLTDLVSVPNSRSGSATFDLFSAPDNRSSSTFNTNSFSTAASFTSTASIPVSFADSNYSFAPGYALRSTLPPLDPFDLQQAPTYPYSPPLGQEQMGQSRLQSDNSLGMFLDEDAEFTKGFDTNEVIFDENFFDLESRSSSELAQFELFPAGIFLGSTFNYDN